MLLLVFGADASAANGNGWGGHIGIKARDTACRARFEDQAGGNVFVGVWWERIGWECSFRRGPGPEEELEKEDGQIPGELDREVDQPPGWAVEQAAEDEPADCADQDPKRGFKVPGVGFLGGDEAGDEGAG